MDEILLARIMEQPLQKVPPGEEYTDETEDEDTEEHMDNEETEYDTRKGRPVIV